MRFYMLSLYITKSKQTEMKKVLLMCAFVVGVSAVSFAQGGGRTRMTPEKQVERLKTTLSMTDDQAAKATTIITDQGKVMDSLRKASNNDWQSMRPAMTKLRKATSDKIMAILTPDQQTVYKKQLADQAARQAARQNGN